MSDLPTLPDNIRNALVRDATNQFSAASEVKRTTIRYVNKVAQDVSTDPTCWDDHYQRLVEQQLESMFDAFASAYHDWVANRAFLERYENDETTRPTT
jgi:hypothetical protein